MKGLWLGKVTASLGALVGSVCRGADWLILKGTLAALPGDHRGTALFGRWAQAPQLHVVQSFPVFKVVVEMLH